MYFYPYSNKGTTCALLDFPTYVRTYMVYRCRVVRLINRPLVDSSRCFIKIGGTNSKRASNTSLFARNGAREL